jgi:methyl-accepting chemotaxis protein
MLGRAVLDLALRPVAVAVAAPSAAWALAGGLVRVAVRGPEELRRTLDLLERAQGLLSLLEPAVRRVAGQVDDRLVDDLVLSARTAPALVATASRAVGEFELFIDHAQGARAAADQLLVDAASLLRRAEAAIGGTEQVLARIDPVVVAAQGTVARADAVAARASSTIGTADSLVAQVSGTAGAADALVGQVEVLVQRVQLVVQLAEAVATTARRAVDDAVELAGRARPAVQQAADLGEQLAEPAAALVPVVRSQAPAVAAMLPDLVHALGDLLTDLPELLRRIDQDVLPTLRSLRSTPGDVRSLRDTVADIEPLVGDVEAELAGLPGSGLLRRRGRKADVDEQAPAAAGPAPSAPQ